MGYVLSNKTLGLKKKEFSEWINTKSHASNESKKRYWREWRRYNKHKRIKRVKRAKEIKVEVSEHLQREIKGMRYIKDVFAKEPVAFTNLTFDEDIKKLARVFKELLKYRPEKANFLRYIVKYKAKTGRRYLLPDYLSSKIRPINDHKHAFKRLEMLLAQVTFSTSTRKVLVLVESIRFYGDLQPQVEGTKNEILDGRH